MRIILFFACMLFAATIFAGGSLAQDTPNDVSKTTPVYSTPAVDAKETNFEKTPLNKITRGITNTVFFWIEVPAGMKETAKEKNDEFTGFSLGFVKGVFASFLRAATGLFDVATFIIPPYNRPLMEPEYVFSRLDS